MKATWSALFCVVHRVPQWISLFVSQQSPMPARIDATDAALCFLGIYFSVRSPCRIDGNAGIADRALHYDVEFLPVSYGGMVVGQKTRPLPLGSTIRGSENLLVSRRRVSLLTWAQKMERIWEEAGIKKEYIELCDWNSLFFLSQILRVWDVSSTNGVVHVDVYVILKI